MILYIFESFKLSKRLKNVNPGNRIYHKTRDYGDSVLGSARVYWDE